jgi:hypothetical protein
MGVTDQPASVGTQELYFSHKNNRASYYAASVRLGRLQDDRPNTAETGLINALTGFFQAFRCRCVLPTETTPPNTESKPPMDEATATALKALVEQLLVVAAGLQAVIRPPPPMRLNPIKT